MKNTVTIHPNPAKQERDKKIIDDIELLHSRYITDESGYRVVLIPRIYWRRLLEATKEKTKRYKNRKEK